MPKVTIFKINPQGHEYLFTGEAVDAPLEFMGLITSSIGDMVPGEYLLLDSWHYARRVN